MGIKIILKHFLSFQLLLLVWLLLQTTHLFADSSILVFRAYGEKFAQTYQGIKDDLGDDFKVIEKIIKPQTPIKEISDSINKRSPKAIALIGNTAVNLYTLYQKQKLKQNPEKNFPPSIVLSALYADRLLPRIKNAQGIRQEIPAVISIRNIQALLKQPVRRVGVLYRKWMKDSMLLNAEYCKKEGIEMVMVELPNKLSAKKFDYQLKHLINENIDALWIANDNALLTPHLIQNIWIPNIKKFNKPVIVGMEGLVATALDFGTFAVIPDQYVLGIQAAGLIIDILDERADKLVSGKIFEPISVKKSLNLNLMKQRHIVVKTSQLETLDRVIN